MAVPCKKPDSDIVNSVSRVSAVVSVLWDHVVLPLKRQEVSVDVTSNGIVGRNFLKFTAGGAATHSDHGREICHTLYCAKDGGNYQVKDPEKLIRIAKEWGVETEGKDIYDLAHEMG